MTDFLEFLNTADLSTLTKIYGVSRPIAGNLIAGRPFETAEDCLKVRGMSKKFLNQIQSTFDVEQSMSERRAMIPVEEDAAPIERSLPEAESGDEEKPSFSARLGRIFTNIIRAIARLLITAAAILGIGAAFYYGIPFLNEKLLMPIQQNTTNINEMQQKIDELQKQVDETSARVDTLEKLVQAHSASLQQLESMQSDLESQLQGNQDKVLLKLRQEVILTRALDTLGRARVYLAQSNFGLAKTDVESARDLLTKLQAETEDKALAQAISRLDLALENLPSFPVVADGDLEIAWQILMSGEVVNIPTETPTSTPSPQPNVAPTTTP